MSNEVYANMMAVSCKAAKGKSICAMPDVCFTPPQTPVTPMGLPIPYPNTGMASDATDGSSTVKISGQEVMLKNKSYFKRSTGDEAGSAPKKGMLTSKTMGKVYFNMWSMDVKVEGENVVRHLDITTHNHASMPGNTPPWPYIDSMASGGSGPCKTVARKIEQNCVGSADSPKSLVVYDKTPERKVKRGASMENMCADSNCREAMQCVVSPYSPNNCCPDANGKKPTPHHVVPKSQFKEPGEGGATLALASGGTYNDQKAPCICVAGASHSEGAHGQIHAQTNTRTREHESVQVGSGRQIPSDKRWEVGDAEKVGSQSVEVITGCPAECTEAQVRKGHQTMGVDKADKVRPTTAGGEPDAGGAGDLSID